MSSTEPTLFDQPPSQRHSATSRQAATQIAPMAAKQRQRDLEFIHLYGPCTDETIANGLKMGPSSARPRRIELVRAGQVRASLRLAETSSGRKAIAWECVP